MRDFEKYYIKDDYEVATESIGKAIIALAAVIGILLNWMIYFG